MTFCVQDTRGNPQSVAQRMQVRLTSLTVAHAHAHSSSHAVHPWMVTLRLAVHQQTAYRLTDKLMPTYTNATPEVGTFLAFVTYCTPIFPALG